jgi:hypothetical protein
MDLSMIFYLLFLDVFDKGRCKIELSDSPILRIELYTRKTDVTLFGGHFLVFHSAKIEQVHYDIAYCLIVSSPLAMDIIYILDIFHSTSFAFDREMLTVLLCSLTKHFLRSENRDITTRVIQRMDNNYYCKVIVS